MQKTCRNHQYAPGSAVSEDASNLALKFYRTTAKLGAELEENDPRLPYPTSKQTSVTVRSDVSIDGHGTFADGSEIVRGLTKRVAEEAVEMEFGKTSLARCLREQHTRLVFAGEQSRP